MSCRQCTKCGGTGRVDSTTCPVCKGKGVMQVFTCPVCNGPYYLRKDTRVRVRCPHCGSILDTDWRSIKVVERGVTPFPPPGSKTPLGAVGGAVLGLAIGGPVGAILGLILGGLAGVVAENPLEAEEV
nr:hypothetical protein [Candidatus Njordarchaeota archaeon]